MVSVAIVGAGSHFTMGLLGDFFRVGLEDSNLILMDINETRLKAIYTAVKNIVEKRKFNLKIKAYTDLEQAMEEVDYAITTIRTGGIKALKTYVELPLKHGTIHLVGDTTGPGGVLKALIEAPAMIKIAETLRDQSPNAILLNFTNPMTPLCTAIQMATKVKTIGLCHGVNHIVNLTSKLLNIDPEKIQPIAAGINHFTWTTGIYYNKQNLLQQLYKELNNPEKIEIIKQHPYLIGKQLFKTFKIPPTLNDRHTSEFFHQLYTWIKDPEIGPILKKSSRYIDFKNKSLLQSAETRDKEWYTYIREIIDGKREIRPSREYALDIILAIEKNETTFLPALNLPNRGLIKDLPEEVFIETPGIVSNSGIHGIKVDLPKPILALLNLHATKYTLLAKGIIENDKTLIEESLNLDPLTPSPLHAHRIIEEYVNIWKNNIDFI